MASKSPIESVVANWNKRAQEFSAQGIDPHIIQTIGQQDIDKVKRGGSGLSNQEALLAITSAANGGQVIPERLRSTKPTSIPGNIVKDIGDTARGLLRLPHAVANIPEDISNTVKAFRDSDYAREIGIEEHDDPNAINPHELGVAARNLNRLPISKWVPLLNTIAGTTTKQGRDELLRHPLGPLLDVGLAALPVAKSAAGVKLASEGKLLSAGSEEAAQALEQGGKAIGRGGKGGVLTSDATDTLAGAVAEKGLPVRYGLKKALDPITNDFITKLEDRVRLSRGFSKMEEEARHEYRKTYANDIASLTKDLSPEARTQLFNDMGEGIRPTEPQLQVAFDKYVELKDKLTQDMTDEGFFKPVNLTIDGQEHTFIYPTLRGTRGNKLLATQEKIVTHEERLAQAQDRLISVANKAERTITKKKGVVDRLISQRDELITKNPTPIRRQKLAALEDKIASKQSEIDNYLTNHSGYQKASKSVARSQRFLDKYNDLFTKRLASTAPANFHPLLANELKARTLAKIEGMDAAPATIEAAMADYAKGKYSTIWDEKDFRNVTKGIEQGWQDLVREGYNPQFIHVVDPENTYLSFKPTDHYFTPGQVKDRVWHNLTPQYQDIGVSISHSAADWLKYKANEEGFIQNILPTGMTEDAVDRAIEPKLQKMVNKGTDPAVARSKLISQGYVKVADLDEFSFRNPRIRAFMGDKNLFIPKHVYETWKDLSYPKPPKGLAKAATKINATFRISLLALSPRHTADELLGGMVMVMGRGGKEEIGSFFDAVKMVKEDTLPTGISHGIDIDTPDKILQDAIGRKSATLFKVVNGKYALPKFNAWIANVERGMSFLGEKKRALAEGYSESAANEIGLKHVEKALVDWSSFLPIERQVIRQVFPFYAFAKYSMQYALTFPIDHPLRASIIYHLAQAEKADRDSGLPELWNQLFFFGHPDDKGDIKAVDLKVINPFRDVDSFFTLKGFYNQLGPIPKATLIPLGVNTITATPELYPDVTYDPETGTLTTKRAGAKDQAIGLLHSVIPPARALDYFLTYSDQMRNQKENNPDSYGRSLLSAVGLVGIPTNYNVQKARSRSELARYSQASQAASSALRSGDPSAVEGFQVVPFQGQMLNINDFTKILNSITNSTPEDISPKSALRPRKGKVTPNLPTSQ